MWQRRKMNGKKNAMNALTAVGKPVIANTPRIGAHRGLSGWTTPKMGFWLKYSKIEPTCRKDNEATNSVRISASHVWKQAQLKLVFIVSVNAKLPKILSGYNASSENDIQAFEKATIGKYAIDFQDEVLFVCTFHIISLFRNRTSIDRYGRGEC